MESIFSIRRRVKRRKWTIHIAGDLPATRPHFEKVADKIYNAAISPSGARAVFEARGEIFTVPAEKGNIRNLTRTPAVAERDPAWSPDGKWIAFFSDESGEYALHMVDQSGSGAVKKIDLGQAGIFFLWPDVVARQQENRLYRQALEFLVRGRRKRRFAPVKVDTDLYEAWGVL